jgi:Flp pilus assembly protein TadG
MRKLLASFAGDRRGAIALIFAGTLLPLVMLIGLSIDYSFYVQARSQFALSADASATYALREATAVYALEDTSTSTSSTAQSEAVSVGETSGADWFTAQLATLPTAYVASGSPTVSLSANTEASTSDPQGFTATVAYTGEYPPFFNKLFQKSSNWAITGTSGATSQFSYVELLIMMDTSGSMLVSADEGNNETTSASNAGGILTMDDNTVCIPNAEILSTTGFNSISSYDDPADIVTWSDVNNLSTTSGITNSNATSDVTCSKGMNDEGGSTTATAGSAYAPCAFACHTTNSTYTASGLTYSGGSSTALEATTDGTYTGDLYGLARKLGVLLKTDVVFQSTETIIEDMENDDLAPDQFSVGVYSFNDDVCPIVDGTTTGEYATGTSDGTTVNLTEATTDLAAALSDVEADDYTYTPSETNYPPLSPSEEQDFTSFPTSVEDLIAGRYGCDSYTSSTSNSTTTYSPYIKVSSGNALASPLSTSTVGTAEINPEKDIFIITDGMEDSSAYASSLDSNISDTSPSTSCGRVLGEMTGIEAEEDVSTTACDQAVCEPLKKLGFTIYVLQVTYPAVEVQFYYKAEVATSDDYIANDFPAFESSTSEGSVEVWNTGEQTSSSATVTEYTSPAPNEQALEACASSGDYYQASSSTAIATAMTDMLKSALDSAERITE